MKKRLAWLTAAIMTVLLLLPCAALGEAVQVTEAVKSACVQAGGELLTEARAVKAASPYGTQSVVLRDAPSDSYHPVAMIMVGQELTVVGTREGFSFVLLEDGSMGWLESDEVR